MRSHDKENSLFWLFWLFYIHFRIGFVRRESRISFFDLHPDCDMVSGSLP